jgi:uncharacterized membrane protein
VFRRPVGLLTVALVSVLWTSALLAAPHALPPSLSAAVYAAGSVVCHQRSERSFHHGGVQYPVCTRCFGLYLGGAIGAAAWALATGVARVRSRPRRVSLTSFRRPLIVAAIPTALSAMASMTGVWDAGNVLRAALALPLGAAIAALVAAVAAGDLE